MCLLRTAPVYPCHLALIIAAYAKVGTAEAATRSFSLDSLGKAAGRSAEVSWTTYDGLSWDSHFQMVFVEIMDSKNSKVKLIPYAAGKTRHHCWYLHLADYLALQPDRVVYAAPPPPPPNISS